MAELSPAATLAHSCCPRQKEVAKIVHYELYGLPAALAAQAQAIANDPAAAAAVKAELLAKGHEQLTGFFYMDRPALLTELRNSAPLLALGGSALVDEIFLASRDVAGWYP